MILSNKVESQLKEYANLILKWNKSINLISKKTESEIWERHIFDSAQIFSHISEDDYVCDLGSGAGLPGIVLSIMGIKNMTLIESDIRKCAFLRQASLLSENQIYIINDRIENYEIFFPRPKVDILISRALNSVDNLLNYSKIFTLTQSFILLKGKNFQKELAEAQENWHFNFKYFISATNPEAVILEIKNVKQKN